MRLFVTSAFLAAALSASPPRAAELSDHDWLWRHEAPLHDLNVDAVLRGGAAFDDWRETFSKVFEEMVRAVPFEGLSLGEVFSAEGREGFRLQQVDFVLPDGGRVGSLLAVPDRTAPDRPVIIALHGHEVPERGQAPYSMFVPGHWAEELVRQGYVVWAPSHLWYEALSGIVDQGHSHHVVWVSLLDRMLTEIAGSLPENAGFVVAGLSSGGVSASFLAALRADVRAGVFAGSLIGLDYLRENYRIVGHPNAFDVRGLMDYTPIFGLIAPRPAQWQFGREDQLFPRTDMIASQGNWFPGTPRPVSVVDFLGEWLVIERLWRNMDAKVDLHLHEGGHEFDVAAALRFLADLAD